MAAHVTKALKNRHRNLFESSWKKPYSDRGIRKMLELYSKKAGINHTVSPHQLRHFLFAWLKKKGIDDALIQPYSGHETRQSLEVYSKLSLADAQKHIIIILKIFRYKWYSDDLKRHVPYLQAY